MTARLLAVDDDPIQTRLIEGFLKNQYDVTCVASGEACLEKLKSERFDIALLDVMLPGISGYDVCKAIKADLDISDLPVIFLSGNADEEDRLRGFEAGGFDYLSKPVAKAELLAKIAILVQHMQATEASRSSAAFATTTAMTAMTSAAEQGLVLQFMTASFKCRGRMSLAQVILDACSQFGLNALVQLRGDDAPVSFSRKGPCTPMETSMLGNLSLGSRFTELGSRVAITYPLVTLILLDMPRDDPERFGRLKDHLAILAEGANARTEAINFESALTQEMSRRAELARMIGERLAIISQELVAQNQRSINELKTITHDILEETMPLLDLSQAQEKQLERQMQRTTAAFQTAQERGGPLEQALREAAELLRENSGSIVIKQ